MRRIVAILIIILIAFLAVYGLFEPFRLGVNDFAIKVIGPVAFNAISGMYTTIVATIGIPGLVAIVAIPVFLLGIITHSFWVKGDWWLRRKFATRTAKDLGTQQVSQFPATPVGATTRPETTKEVVAKVEVEPAKEEPVPA